MQNVVAVRTPAENVGIQRLSRYRSTASSPPNLRITLAPTRNLTMRICAALLLSASTLFAAATDVCAQAKEQFNSPNNNSIERRSKSLWDATCGLRFTPVFAPIAARVHCIDPAGGCSRPRQRHCQARDAEGDQSETMFGGRGAGICRVLSRRSEFQRCGSLRTGN